METTSPAISHMPRPLCSRYRAVHFEVLSVHVCEGGSIRQGECLWALGVQADGRYETLGTWPSTGATLELCQAIREELRRRGVSEIEIVSMHELDMPGVSPLRLRAIAAAQELASQLQSEAIRALRRRGMFSDMGEAQAYLASVLDRLEVALGDVDVKRAARRLACPGGLRSPIREVSGRTH